jgi:membrane protein YqaA with SNARE-associated domain
MPHWIRRGVAYLQHFVGRWWYIPLVALLAAADAFILVVPIDPLLLARTLTQRKRWWLAVIGIAFGSALGAFILAAVVKGHSDWINHSVLSHVEKTKDWNRALDMIEKYGTWGIWFISMGPLPQHPAVIAAALSKIPLWKIFTAAFSARLIKYGAYGILSVYAPGLLMKIAPIRRAVQNIDTSQVRRDALSMKGHE